VQQVHEPANAEQRCEKTAETIDSVSKPFAIGTLRHQTEDNAREEREQNGHFKVIEIDLHSGLVLLMGGDLVRIHDAKDIEQSGRDNELGTVLGSVAGLVGRRVAKPYGNEV